jgi:hypothetical protein
MNGARPGPQARAPAVESPRDAIVPVVQEPARGKTVVATNREIAWKHIGVGIAAAAVGGASTLFTYGSAVAYGGLSYTAAWTSLSIGAIETVRGLILLAHADDFPDGDDRAGTDRG